MHDIDPLSPWPLLCFTVSAIALLGLIGLLAWLSRDKHDAGS
jgi:hypothetical protein